MALIPGSSSNAPQAVSTTFEDAIVNVRQHTSAPACIESVRVGVTMDSTDGALFVVNEEDGNAAFLEPGSATIIKRHGGIHKLKIKSVGASEVYWSAVIA